MHSAKEPINPPAMSVFRFAPSPNGFLHLGHAYSVLLNQKLARESGGRLLLRIEDIDQERCRLEYEAAIHEDLGWLGVEFDGSTRRQSEHLTDYAAALGQLRSAGLVYPAFMSRSDIAREIGRSEAAGEVWPRDPDGTALYPARERGRPEQEAAARVAAGEPHALRLRTAEAVELVGPLTWREAGEGIVRADPLAWGDVILAGRETATSYHLAVVVDDAIQGVTDVVRGRDLYPATAIHRLLQTLLGLPEPRYRHHRLILDDDGRKLAKSSRSTGLRELRAAGVDPEEVRRVLFDDNTGSSSGLR